MQDKLTDKPFLRLALTSLFAILFCIMCLCSTTYAWFNANTKSASNQIKSSEIGNFSVEVIAADGSVLDGIQNGVTLTAGEVYTVKLSLGGGNASGYCLISAGENTYYSCYILRHENEMETVTFDLKVETTQTVTFTPRWGIYTGECDVVDGALIIP